MGENLLNYYNEYRVWGLGLWEYENKETPLFAIDP